MSQPAETNLSAPQGEEVPDNSALSFDAIITVLRRFWYLVLLFTIVGGAGGYYLAGTRNYVYQKTASVMMRNTKNDQNAASERIMSDLGVESGNANLANESFVLKSTSLMSRVVESQKLNISYGKKVDLRLIDLYKSSPILVQFSTIDSQKSCQFTITPQDDISYHLTYTNTLGKEELIIGDFGKEITLPFAKIIVHPTAHMSNEWIKQGIVVSHVPVLAAAREFLAGLSVVRPDNKEASLLEMTLNASHPDKAEDVLNQLISVYNQVSKDERSKAAQKTRYFIRERLVQLGAELNRVDKQINDFKSQSSIVTDTASTLSNNLSTAQALDKDIFEKETQLKLAEKLADSIHDTKQGISLIPVDNDVADSGISRQIESYNEAYLEYRKISMSAGAKNPIAVSLRERMDSMLIAVNKSLTNYRSNLDIQIDELRKKRSSLDKNMITMSDRDQEITPLVREHKVKEELYLALLTKEQENALALAVAESSARVLESAHGSSAPITPDTKKYTTVGAIAGGVLCLSFFLGLQMLNNKVKSKRDLMGISDYPLLAEIPQLSRKEQKQTQLLLQDDHSVCTEHFHILRHNVDSLLPHLEHSGNIIEVTSTIPGEGKTFVSANLAVAFAKAGKRILLIDGDLRKYSLSRQLGLKGRRGLSSLLLNEVSDPSEVIRTIDVGNEQHIEVLGAGPSIPNPITLLSQPRLHELLQQFKSQYDAVLIDAPPHGIIADTALLAEHADITLYTIRSGMIDKRYLTHLKSLGDTGKFPHMAFVLNGVNFKASGYSYYGYNYYGYGQHHSQNA
jgi:capsular exopolysaccharide synthesis family protein